MREYDATCERRHPYLRSRVRSERQPGRELECAGAACAEDLIDAIAWQTKSHRGRLRFAGDNCRRRIQPAPISGQVGNVEDIERLGDQRETDLLTNSNQPR